MPNRDDVPFQQRLLVINFDPLQDDGCDIEYSTWKSYLELSSACCADFDTFLVDGRLDDLAIKDCVSYLEKVVTRRRDRSANMWGQLLCYMLNLNYCFQSTADNADTIAWVVTQCTGSALDRCNSLGLLQQFIVAVDEMRNDAGCNPLGQEARTIFWHNYREMAVNQGELGLVPIVSIRLESVINVIRTVKGVNFQRPEIRAAARRETWAQTGRAQFYDTQTQPWPITKTHIDIETQHQTQVPLLESELVADSLKQQQCLHVRKAEYDRIVRDFKAQGQQTLGYKDINIESAFRAGLVYNFYTVLTDEQAHGKWPGYRMAEQSNYSYFCGANNWMCCGSRAAEAVWLDGTDPDLYSLDSLMHHFSYEPPLIGSLPHDYVKIPWAMRNGDGDEEPEEEFPEEDDMDIDPVGPHQECTFDLQSGGETSGPESGGPDFESQQGNGADDRGVEGRSPIEKIGEGASFEDDESEVRRHPKSLAQGCPRLDVSPKSHRQPWYGVPQLVLVRLFFHTGGQRTPYWRRLAPSAQVALR